MQTEELGFLLGQAIIETRQRTLPTVSQIVGQAPASISEEYLALLMWAATVVVSSTLGQYTQPTLDVMHAQLYEVGVGDRARFILFLRDRYSGYRAAFNDNSGGGEGMRLYHVARYFQACCRNPGRVIKYEEVMLDFKDLKVMHDAGYLRSDFYPAMVQWLEDRTNMFIDGLKRVLSKAGDDIGKFIGEMHSMLGGLPWGSMRMVSQCDENQALQRIGIKLMEARTTGGSIMEKELMTVAKEYAIPPSYSMDMEKPAQITLHFTSFMKGVESLVSDFVKEL